MGTEIVFSHGGSMFAYYLGIAEVLQQFDLEDVVFSATSSGCFPSMILNSKKDPKQTFDSILEFIKNNNNKWEDIIRQFLEQNFTEQDVEMNNDKLYCKLTKLNGFLIPEKVSVKNWHNKQDFVDCIVAACYIPVMCGTKPYIVYRNEKTMDGFFSGTSNMPLTCNKNIVFHINKWRSVNPLWMLPSNDVQWLTALYNLGFMDATEHIDELKMTLKMNKEKELKTQNDSIPESK